MASAAGPRGRLFRKYAVLFATLVSGALLVSGGLEVYFSFRENQAALVAVQREKAAGAAARIEQFVREIERQVAWTARSPLGPGLALEQRRVDYLRLLRLAPAVTEVALADNRGRERLRVSRLAMDVIDGGQDLSTTPAVVEARSGRTHFGPVYFRKESEPYMTLAVGGGDGGVTVAEVNLKFIWDVVSRIRVGRAGHAYVADAEGHLIAHPDISLVLRKQDLSGLEQVRAARAAGAEGDAAPAVARNLAGQSVLTAAAAIAPLGWLVFVEQPVGEALAPLYASLLRTAFLLLLGAGLAVLASLLLARRMVTPIRALEAGAARIGAGALDQRIEVRTGDELEALADRFNEMAARLRESYATLEQKVQDRTRALTEALEQQTATAEILRVISGSPTDIQPVFEVIARSAWRLCDALFCAVFQVREGRLHLVAQQNFPAAALAEIRDTYPTPVADGPYYSSRTLRRRTVTHVPDVAADPDGTPEARAYAQTVGYRSLLQVPMLRGETALGVVAVARAEPGPFSEVQVGLLRTFADQAAIAVDNVRLFQELEARTRELARSVEQLRALGQVGQAVSSTLDLGTVLTTIVSRAVELSGAAGGAVYEYDEARRVFLLRATHGLEPDFVERARAAPVALGEGGVGRAGLLREPVEIPDILAPGAYQGRHRELAVRASWRALLALPLLREERLLGGLVVNRPTPGRFSPETVELLRAFATQSALAIQNARLYRALEEQSRELETASRHKSQFLANMSHELRTPLNAVIGFSEVLAEQMFGELNDKQMEYVHDILSSGRHLLALINDILDLAKVEAGRLELELAPFDLPATLEAALVLVRERASRHGLTLSLEVDERLGTVVGDERKVRQVVLNLLSNAVKFTPEGGRVEVRARLADGHAEVAVRDTGIGIAPEDQALIFEEFRQVGGDYARKREGTGLGLALARRFVELHGGAIRVESVPGEGSTFTVRLPLGAAPPA